MLPCFSYLNKDGKENMEKCRRFVLGGNFGEDKKNTCLNAMNVLLSSWLLW